MLAPEASGDLIGRFLRECGEWAWDEVAFVGSTLPDDAKVLDVGAYVGTFGLGLSTLGRLKSVHFVEANPQAAAYLKENIDSNLSPCGHVIEAIVTGQHKATRIGRAQLGNLGSASFSEASDGDITFLPAERRLTLADLDQEFGPFDLIKLDVEGMELEVLEASTALLSGGQTSFWVECNDTTASLLVADLLISSGVDVYYFAFPSHNPENFNAKQDPIIPFAFEAGLLAAPHRTPTLNDALASHQCVLRRIQSSEGLREAMWLTPRWGKDEWIGADATHLVALLGHELSGEGYQSYLRTGDDRGDAEGSQRGSNPLEQANAALAEAQALAYSRYDEISRLTDQLTRTDRALNEAQSIAFSQTDELSGITDQLRRTEQALAEAQSLAYSQAAEMAALSEQLRQTDAALGQAQTLAYERADEVARLSSQLAQRH
ncbi:FkbM family methyltransferase [uncultured Enterovirga sp.]|uniref:FkbM family methyltransferase n=1 Tax=uncultured Enterovirga sp. TaxID=2026352 RepID=UPI0035CB3510